MIPRRVFTVQFNISHIHNDMRCWEFFQTPFAPSYLLFILYTIYTIHISTFHFLMILIYSGFYFIFYLHNLLATCCILLIFIMYDGYQKFTSWRTRSDIRFKRSNKRFLICDCKFAYTTNPFRLNLWMKCYFTEQKRNCFSFSIRNWFFINILDYWLCICYEAQ